MSFFNKVISFLEEEKKKRLAPIKPSAEKAVGFFKGAVKKAGELPTGATEESLLFGGGAKQVPPQETIPLKEFFKPKEYAGGRIGRGLAKDIESAFMATVPETAPVAGKVGLSIKQALVGAGVGAGMRAGPAKLAGEQVTPKELLSSAALGAGFSIFGGVQPKGGTRAILKAEGEKLNKAEKIFNINLDRLRLSEPEKVTLKSTIESVKPQLEGIRGKTLSHQEILEAAKQSEALQTITTREATKQAIAAEVRARQQMVALDKEITSLIKVGDTKTLKTRMKDLIDSLKIISSDSAEAGRRLEAKKIIAKDTSIRQEILKRVLKVEEDTDKIIKESLAVDWNNSKSVEKFYRRFIKPSTGEILDAYRYNNMLSNPRTQIRNAFSNITQTFGVRPLVKLISGDVKGAAQYYKGAFSSLPEAVNGFGKTMSGETPIEKTDLKQALKYYNMPGLLGVPTRLMEASDRFFSTLIMGGEQAGGKTLLEAKEIAEYSLFRAGLDPTGKKGQAVVLRQIDKLTNWMFKAPKFVRWFIPFLRTPMNFAKQWIEYSPAGLATLPGAAKKKEQLAKFLLGSTATTIGAMMAANNATSWSAPKDQEDKSVFYESGRRPYSVKIGNQWVPMATFGPFALALALPAALKHYQEQSTTALTDSDLKKIGRATADMAAFFSQQTFLSGLGSFVRLAQGDTDISLGSTLAFTAGQMIPMEGLVRYVATVMDPIYRKSKGFKDTLIRDFPQLSKQLEAYKTPTGEDSRRNLSAYIAPFTMGEEKQEYESMLQTLTELSQKKSLETKESKEKSTKAKEIVNSWGALTESEIEQRAMQIKQDDPQLFDKVKELYRETKKMEARQVGKLSLIEEKIKSLGVASGARAEAIAELIRDKSPDEQKAIIKDLGKKGIVTRDVLKQLLKIKSGGTI